MDKINKRKAEKLYAVIDNSKLYFNEVEASVRSWMNVSFKFNNTNLEAKFLEESKIAGLLNLKGHKAYGGMRASIYNAMPEEGVDALVDFLKAFEVKYQ